MKKVLILNASPRKKWNTAMLLHKTEEAALAKGFHVKYVDLYDMTFTGCRACMACKKKGAIPNKCYWKDDLSPLLDEIFEADHLILGSPIYLGDTTSQFHALLERMDFVSLSYNDYSCTYKGKLNMDVFPTMNASKEYYENYMLKLLQPQFSMLERFGGEVKIHPVFETLQVNDYSKYEMKSFDEESRKLIRATRFNHDLENAYQIGLK